MTKYLCVVGLEGIADVFVLTANSVEDAKSEVLKRMNLVPATRSCIYVQKIEDLNDWSYYGN